MQEHHGNVNLRLGIRGPPAFRWKAVHNINVGLIPHLLSCIRFSCAIGVRLQLYAVMSRYHVLVKNWFFIYFS